MSTPLSALICATLDQELAELRDDPLPHTLLAHIAQEMRVQFPACHAHLARVTLCAARAINGLIEDCGIEPDLGPSMLSLLAGELDRMEREATS